MICFSSERIRSANVGLMLGNVIVVRTILNIHCGVPGVFASADHALSPVDVITGCDDVLVALQATVYCRLVTAVYHWKDVKIAKK